MARMIGSEQNVDGVEFEMSRCTLHSEHGQHYIDFAVTAPIRVFGNFRHELHKLNSTGPFLQTLDKPFGKLEMSFFGGQMLLANMEFASTLSPLFKSLSFC